MSRAVSDRLFRPLTIGILAALVMTAMILATIVAFPRAFSDYRHYASAPPCNQETAVSDCLHSVNGSVLGTRSTFEWGRLVFVDLFADQKTYTVQLAREGSVGDALQVGAPVSIELWHPQDTVTAIQTPNGRLESAANPAAQMRDLFAAIFLVLASGGLLIGLARGVARRKLAPLTESEEAAEDAEPSGPDPSGRALGWGGSWINTGTFPAHEQAFVGAAALAVGTATVALFAAAANWPVALAAAAVAFSVWMLGNLASIRVRTGLAGVEWRFRRGAPAQTKT